MTTRSHPGAALHAADVMTRALVTVTPQATVKAAAELLLQHGVSGLPVLDDVGELVGIVTAADLLRRAEQVNEQHDTYWNSLLDGHQRRASPDARAPLIADVMTRGPLFVTPEASLSKIVGMMDAHQIRRLPVLSNGRLVGIVSCSDLLRALLLELPDTLGAKFDDEQIRLSICMQISQQSWAPSAGLGIAVHAGVVELTGSLRQEAERARLLSLVQNTAGVKGIVDLLVRAESLPGTILEQTGIVTSATASSESDPSRTVIRAPTPKFTCPDWNRSF